MADRPHFTPARPDGRVMTTAGFIHAYLKHLQPRLAFDPALTVEDFPAWREQVREKLRGLMCFPADLPPQPEPVHLWTEEREGYQLQKWEAYPEPLSVAPYLVLVPQGAGAGAPRPAVMCFPGSTWSKESLAGEPDPDGGRPDSPHWEANRMALHYVRAGMVAVAVDNPGIGELRDPITPERTQVVMNGMWAGRHYEGLSVFTKLPILDWLKKQPYVDPSRIATAGHSLGAKPALILGVLHPEIAAVVWNDFCCDCRRRAIVTNLQPIAYHQYIPGLLPWFDYPDLMASLAPRPFLITEGGHTPDFARVRQAYRLLGAESRMHVTYYPKYAEANSRPYDGVDLPEGLSMEEYLTCANVDVPQHSFKASVAVPWLTEMLQP